MTYFRYHTIVSLFALLLCSCASLPSQQKGEQASALYLTDTANRLERFAPAFVVEVPEKSYNRIGQPIVEKNPEGTEKITVDPDTPVIYAEERTFLTDRAAYTNLVYRVHFEKVPGNYLAAGRNVGLIVVITLNAMEQPVLIATVHTCGCYLGLLSTSYLDDSALPQSWQRQNRQSIYGQSLPRNLDFKDKDLNEYRIVLELEDGTHRVTDVRLANAENLLAQDPELMSMEPLLALEGLQTPTGATSSFFYQAGHRQGYVKQSSKPWERLLISWWALDWYVGEDKKLGRDLSDGTVFYTSLKPWARNDSDMRDFATFLAYWGWGL